MKTDELINALSADGLLEPRPARALAQALAPAILVAFALFVATLGFRPHLLVLLGDARLLFKILLCDLLAVLAGAVALGAFYPQGVPRRTLALLLAPLLLLAAAVLAELLAVPADDWSRRLVGHNAMVCLRAIPFLGLAPLAAGLYALRNGAPRHPARAGAAAGLFAGAIGAALYAMHCPDDSPLFMMIWYVLAIAMLTGLGALVGGRFLRW